MTSNSSLNKISESNVPKADRNAIKEETELFGRNLRKNAFSALKTFLWFAVVILLVTIVFRVYHLLAPENMRWLTTEDLQSIDKFLFSGLLGAVAGKLSTFVYKK